jgi:hypothetical protein
MGVAEGLLTMAKNEKEHEKRQAYRREQALLQSRRDAEKADELARIARLIGPAKAEADAEVKITDQNPTPKDIRVKIVEVEDEDVKCDLAKDVREQEASLSDDNPHTRTTYDQDTVLDGLDDSSSDEMSDGDDSGYVENSNEAEFLPPDFHGYDDIDDLLDLQSSSILGPSTEPMGPIAEQKAKQDDDSLNWNSVGQLVAFREASVAIGHDYLKSQGVKLRTARKRKFAIKSEAGSQLYREGREDAKCIDVRRKLLKGAEDD